MQADNLVIVFGGNHHNTLGVIRSLGEVGIRSNVVLCSDNINDCYVIKSRYILTGAVFNSHEKCLAYIENKFTCPPQRKHVLICTSDAAASLIDLNYDKLKSDFFIPNGGKQQWITQLMNKETMSNLALKTGLNVPKTWVINTKEYDISNVKYPCITKPLVSKEGNKSDIIVCENAQQLKDYLSGKHCAKLQIQEFIEKDFEYQLIGCSLDGGNEIVIPGVSIVIRPSAVSNTGFLKYVPLEKFSHDLTKCYEFIKETHYSGLFSLEFLRDKSGIDYFMEINFRNDGNSICVTSAGVNLPYIWYLYNLGMDYKKELYGKNIKEIYVMPEFTDFSMMLKGKVSFIQWIKDVAQTDCFMEFDKKDMRPFFSGLKLNLLRIVKKKFRL